MIPVASTVQKRGEALWYDGHLTEKEFHPVVIGIPHTLIHEYSLKEKITLLLSVPVCV